MKANWKFETKHYFLFAVVILWGAFMVYVSFGDNHAAEHKLGETLQKISEDRARLNEESHKKREEARRRRAIEDSIRHAEMAAHPERYRKQASASTTYDDDEESYDAQHDDFLDGYEHATWDAEDDADHRRYDSHQRGNAEYERGYKYGYQDGEEDEEEEDDEGWDDNW